MQSSSLERLGPLERRLTVEVPEDRIAPEVQSRLAKLARSVRIDGFRRGRVPLRLVEQRFGGQVREEVIEDLVQSSFAEAVTKESLRPAGTPEIESLESKPGQGCAYKATFEVYPEIQLAPMENLRIRVPVCEITEADVDRMIETLRNQKRRWEAVDRPAEKGDQLDIDFHGTIEGQPFAGGDAHGFRLELGSGRFIEGFEDRLIGVRGGDEVTLDLTFPKHYHKTGLAEKPVRFLVKVNEVAQAVLPEVNEAFFQQFGVKEGGLEAFRKELRRSLDREREQTVKSKVKTNVLNALFETNPVELPKVLVEREARNLHQDARQRLFGLGIAEQQTDVLEPKMFEEEAKKRVALGLIASEIIRMAGLKPDPAKVRLAVEGIASSYENPSGIISWYYANKERLADIESLVLENEAVDWVLARARLEEYPITFDALMNPRQTESKADT